MTWMVQAVMHSLMAATRRRLLRGHSRGPAIAELRHDEYPAFKRKEGVSLHIMSCQGLSVCPQHVMRASSGGPRRVSCQPRDRRGHLHGQLWYPQARCSRCRKRQWLCSYHFMCEVVPTQRCKQGRVSLSLNVMWQSEASAAVALVAPSADAQTLCWPGERVDNVFDYISFRFPFSADDLGCQWGTWISVERDRDRRSRQSATEKQQQRSEKFVHEVGRSVSPGGSRDMLCPKETTQARM